MEEQVEVEIIGCVMTARYGNLGTGDILRTDRAFADHLVKDCGAAKYRETPVKEVPIEEAPATKPKRAKGSEG